MVGYGKVTEERTAKDTKDTKLRGFTEMLKFNQVAKEESRRAEIQS